MNAGASRSTLRLRLTAAVLGALLLPIAGATAATAPPAVGEPVPDLALSTIDDSVRALSQRDGATILVFFRGVW